MRNLGCTALVLAGACAAGEPWEHTGSTGIRLVGERDGWIHHARGGTEPKYVGPLTATGPDGAVLLAATFNARGVAVDLRLPQARLAPPRPEPGKEAISGAFGLTFGPDLAQFASLTCGGRPCVDVIARGLIGSMAHGGLERAADHITIAFVDGPPAPPRGGRSYTLTFSLAEGLYRIEGDVAQPGREACEREAARLDALLRDRFGECGPAHNPAAFVGECTRDGLPVRDASAFCLSFDEHHVDLSYAVRGPGQLAELRVMAAEFRGSQQAGGPPADPVATASESEREAGEPSAGKYDAPLEPLAATPSILDLDHVCERHCYFHRGTVENCNAGRDPEDTVRQPALERLANEFYHACVPVCMNAPGNQQHFNVDIELDRRTPGFCAYAWKWCTPGEDWTSCSPELDGSVRGQ